MVIEGARVGHRRVIGLAVPIILANLTQPIVSAVDTGVAGHLADPSYLGGVALGGLLFNFLFWGFGFLRMGTTGLIAQAHGAGEAEGLRSTLLRALSVAGVIGTAVLLLQEPLIEGALALLGGSPAVRANASVYCHARIWSAPLALANYVVLGYLLGLQRVRLGLLLQVVINLVNIVAVFVLVFAAHAGLGGIGWAAALADGFGFMLGMVIVARLWPRGLARPELAVLFEARALRKLLFINLNLFLRTICLLGTFAWFAHEGARQGDVILAGNAILLNFQTFMAYALDGFANATEALVGAAIGAGDRRGLRAAIRVSTLWAGVTAAAFVLFYVCAGSGLIDLLTSLPAVAAAAQRYLPWAAVSPLICVWGFQFDGVFIGATRTRELMLAMFFSCTLFGASAAVLEPRFGNDGLWCALLVFMAARGLSLAALLPRLVAASGHPGVPSPS